MKTIICNKDLYHADGTLSFSKGGEYQVNPFVSYLTRDTQTKNNQNEPHCLGVWLKHFRLKN